MSNLIIEKLLAKTQRTDIPAFHPGDTVRVHVKIKEGDKERLQAFEGVVIKRDNGPQASFTVRKISFGQGVERIFPIHSKVIDKVDLLRSSKRRACATSKDRAEEYSLLLASRLGKRRRGTLYPATADMCSVTTSRSAKSSMRGFFNRFST